MMFKYVLAHVADLLEESKIGNADGFQLNRLLRKLQLSNPDLEMKTLISNLNFVNSNNTFCMNDELLSLRQIRKFLYRMDEDTATPSDE